MASADGLVAARESLLLAGTEGFHSSRFPAIRHCGKQRTGKQLLTRRSLAGIRVMPPSNRRAELSLEQRERSRRIVLADLVQCGRQQRDNLGSV